MTIRDTYVKLDRATSTDGPAPAGEGANRPSPTGRTTTGITAPSTRVTLSPRAHELARMADPSAARVSALREQISSGGLRVDARAIASKLLGGDS